MADSINNQAITLIASQFFSNIVNSKSIKIAEFDAILSILIKAKIPFDVTYNPGNNRNSEAAQLTIFLSPSTTLNFNFSFQPGEGLFTGTPAT